MSTNYINNSRRKFFTTLSLAATASLLNPPSLFASNSKITKKALVPTTLLRLPTDSNCEIVAIGKNKVEVKFPYGKGYLKPGRNIFRDEDDLINYLLEAFLMEKDEKGGMRGTVRCVSAYERINESGKSIFTFEDPILDLITDEDGNLTISGTRINAKDIVLANERESFSLNKAQVSTASIDAKLSNLVSKASFSATQSIPSQIFFPSSSAIPRIRFKAYIDVAGSVWRAGANIKTKKLDFVSASITGHYALDPITCFEVKTDFDSDTTDNFLNEFEFGVNSTPASGVRSECRALWNGINFRETVAKGCFA
ncbi:MAG: hypothetical protein HY819_18515 [Acidobacteria bacterium]|nr:hypothetical protein [Acidobacteriota bacterium]